MEYAKVGIQESRNVRAIRGDRWPWCNESLDPDIKKLIHSAGLENLDIFDPGTCSGSQGIELAKLGHRVVGTDISETALAQAEYCF